MRSGQAGERSCMRACMYALSSVSVHRSPLCSECGVKPCTGFTSEPSTRALAFFFPLPSGYFAQLPAVWAAAWASVWVYQSCLHPAPERPSYMDALTQPPSDAAASDSLWLDGHTLLLTGGFAETSLAILVRLVLGWRHEVGCWLWKWI